MYSFFDTFNLRAEIGAGNAPQDDYLIHIDWYDRRMPALLSESHKLLGWGLIATGVLIAYQQVVMGVLDQLMWSGGHNSVAFRAFYLMMDQVPQVLVCVVLILCGVRLVRGPRSAQRPPEQAPEEFCNYTPPLDGGPLPCRGPCGAGSSAIIQAAMQPHQEVENDDRDDQNNDQSDGQ